jgi:hypothetical protein
MAQRPSTPDDVQAVFITASQLLSYSDRQLLVKLLREQENGNAVSRSADDAAADLATAATVLTGIAAFATALGTAGWEVAD